MPLIKGRTVRPRKTVIYGDGGVGKTTWALSAPRSLGLPIEPGMDEFDNERFPVATTHAEFVANCREAYGLASQFSHVVVDSADWLYELCKAEAGRLHGFTSIEQPDYGKGWKWADEVFFGTLRILDKLHAAGLGVIVICHAQVRRFADPMRDSYDRWEPKLRPEARDKLVEWADEVFFASLRVYTKSADVGFNRTEVKAVGTSERILQTAAKPSAYAKNRLAMPDEIPMTWDAYAAHFPGAATPAPVDAA